MYADNKNLFFFSISENIAKYQVWSQRRLLLSFPYNRQIRRDCLLTGNFGGKLRNELRFPIKPASKSRTCKISTETFNGTGL